MYPVFPSGYLLASEATPTSIGTAIPEASSYGLTQGPREGRVKKHLNTLFVTTDRAYVAKEGEAVVVRAPDDDRKLRVPIHMLHSIVCFGTVRLSPRAMALCASRGVSVSHHTTTGKLLARVVGFTPGNVLLRRAQFRAAEDANLSLDVARAIVQGKLHNCRVLLRRAVRDHGDEANRLGSAATVLRRTLVKAGVAEDLDVLRGLEGDAARAYFECLPTLIRSNDERLQFEKRSRRPPLDPLNAMLSFAYAILCADVRSACESVGLDGQVGFLHSLRSGRPALALDLMEELRPIIADRVVLSLVNRGQVDGDDFEYQPSGAVRMKEGARKVFLQEYQRRKTEALMHGFLGEKVTLGFVPFLQARLLGKALRGELDGYPPFLWR